MPIRNCRKSPVEQGVDEELPRTICTSPWQSTPLAASFVAKDITAGYTDVSASVLSVSGSGISGNDITTPIIKGLIQGHTYRIETKFTTAGSRVWEFYFEIQAGM